MATLFLVFGGTSILFSIVTTSIYIPTNSVGGFPFFPTLSSICYPKVTFSLHLAHDQAALDKLDGPLLLKLHSLGLTNMMFSSSPTFPTLLAL